MVNLICWFLMTCLGLFTESFLFIGLLVWGVSGISWISGILVGFGGGFVGFWWHWTFPVTLVLLAIVCGSSVVILFDRFCRCSVHWFYSGLFSTLKMDSETKTRRCRGVNMFKGQGHSKEHENSCNIVRSMPVVGETFLTARSWVQLSVHYTQNAPKPVLICTLRFQNGFWNVSNPCHTA